MARDRHRASVADSKATSVGETGRRQPRRKTTAPRPAHFDEPEKAKLQTHVRSKLSQSTSNPHRGLLDMLDRGTMPTLISPQYNIYNSLFPEYDLPAPPMPTTLSRPNQRVAAVEGTSRGTFALGAGRVALIIPGNHWGNSNDTSCTDCVVWEYTASTIELTSNVLPTSINDDASAARIRTQLPTISDIPTRRLLDNTGWAGNCFMGARTDVRVVTPIDGTAVLYALDPNKAPRKYGMSIPYTSALPSTVGRDFFFPVTATVKGVGAIQTNQQITVGEFINTYEPMYVPGASSGFASLVSAGDTEPLPRVGYITNPIDEEFGTDGVYPQKNVHTDLGMTRGCLAVYNAGSVSITFSVTNRTDITMAIPDHLPGFAEAPRLSRHLVPDMSELTLAATGTDIEDCTKQIRAMQRAVLEGNHFLFPGMDTDIFMVPPQRPPRKDATHLHQSQNTVQDVGDWVKTVWGSLSTVAQHLPGALRAASGVMHKYGLENPWRPQNLAVQ